MISITQKTKGWEDRLDNLFAERAPVPFEWGKQDCCTFTRDAIAAITETEPMQGVNYTTRFGAFKSLKNHYNTGFLNTFIKIFDDLGFEEVDEVKFGDILFARIIIDDPEEARRFGDVTMAVGYNDLGVIIAPAELGLALIEDYELVRGWRI
jgi:hypothetical protein